MAIRQYCALRNVLSVDRSIFSTRQNYFEKMVELYESDEASQMDEDEERLNAKIVVSVRQKKGVLSGKRFLVNDLASALRIAKDGDGIFLDEGIYRPPEAIDASKKAVFEMKKAVNITGASCSTAVIAGSLVKWGQGTITMRRLRLVIGEDDDENHEAYIMSGGLELTDCVVESTANTAFYVISDVGASHTRGGLTAQPLPPGVAPSSVTRLKFRHCVLNGKDKCRRMVCFQGPHPIVNLEACYVHEMFSFLTVISPDEVTRGVVTLVDSVLYDVQDGVKIVVHHASTVAVHAICCQFEMTRHEEEAPSHAFSMTGGSALAQNCVVYGGDAGTADFVGFSLHSLRRAEMEMCVVETSAENSRQTVLAEGLVVSECLVAILAGVEVIGARIAFRLSNMVLGEANSAHFRDCAARNCSLAVEILSKAIGVKGEDLHDINLNISFIQVRDF